MSLESYSRLASALDKLPNGFPRTESGVEIKILEKIFKPEEAEAASHLSRNMESSAMIAKRTNLDEKFVEQQLSTLARRGMIGSTVKDGVPLYRLAPWIVGIYEA